MGQKDVTKGREDYVPAAARPGIPTITNHNEITSSEGRGGQGDTSREARDKKKELKKSELNQKAN